MKIFGWFVWFMCGFAGYAWGQEMKCGYYPDGKLRYRGYFENGQPRGEWVRYYPEGSVKARMNYGKDTVEAVLYNRKGDYSMAGRYVRKKKTGIWTFHKGERLVAREEYRDGLLDGMSVRFTEAGTVVEEKHWKEGRPDGEWKLFFPDGRLKLQTCYVAGELTGDMVSYFPEGALRAKGKYRHNLKEGEWVFYDAAGELVRKQVFHKGIAEDAGERETEESRQLDALINSGKKIPDPALFADDPEAYMKITGME